MDWGDDPPFTLPNDHGGNQAHEPLDIHTQQLWDDFLIRSYRIKITLVLPLVTVPLPE